MKERDIDLFDCSSGGITGDSNMPVVPRVPGYQVGFSERIRREVGIPTIAVGLITDAQQAEDILQTGQADLVALARELLANAEWPVTAAKRSASKIPSIRCPSNTPSACASARSTRNYRSTRAARRPRPPCARIWASREGLSSNRVMPRLVRGIHRAFLRGGKVPPFESPSLDATDKPWHDVTFCNHAIYASVRRPVRGSHAWREWLNRCPPLEI